jgi:hypothetical protein
MAIPLAGILAAIKLTTEASNIVTAVMWGAVQIRKWYKEGNATDATTEDMVQQILRDVPNEMKQRYGLDNIAAALLNLSNVMHILHQGKEANLKASV